MATATAIIAFVLGLGYIFVGHLVVGRWNVDATDGVLLLGRRMGAVYLGLAVMFFSTRGLGPSRARTALSLGAAVALSLLALLGLYEFTTGHAAFGILVSSIFEALLAAGFLRVLVNERRDFTAL